jgi:hypothetical protein
MCCGQMRTEWRTRARDASPAAPLASTPPSADAITDVTLRYEGTRAIAVRGPVTGRGYVTPGPGATLRVHSADAPALRRTSLCSDP